MDGLWRWVAFGIVISWHDDPVTSPMRFAAVLRTRRTVVGLTQQELADRAGIGVRTIRELERARVGRPQRETVRLLADALSLTGSSRDAFLTLPR